MSAARLTSLLFALALTSVARADGADDDDVVVDFRVLPAAPPQTPPDAPPGRLIAKLEVTGGALPAGLRVANGTLDAATGTVECAIARTAGALVLYVGNQEAWRRDFHVPAGERRITLSLGTGAGLRGRVLAITGEPMRRAIVTLEGSEANDPRLERGLITAQAVADDEGRFRFPWLPACDVTLTLAQGDDLRRHALWSGRVPADGLELEVRDETAWLEGTLFSSDGSDTTNAIVLAFLEQEAEAGPPAAGPRARLQMGVDAAASPWAGQVQSDGRFVIQVPGGRRVALRAMHYRQGNPPSARWSSLGPAVSVAPGERLHLPPVELPPPTAAVPLALVRVDVSGIRGDPYVVLQVLARGRVVDGMSAGDGLVGAFLLPNEDYTLRIVRPGAPAWVLRNVKVTGPALLRPTPR